MRRIIVSMNITVDGFISGPDGELDWHFNYWTPDMAECMGMQLSNADTILLGKNTYTAMAAYWPTVECGLSVPRDDVAFAGMMNSYRKIVCSGTLTKLNWNNSCLMKGNLCKEIIRLKKQDGKDIMIYGSGKLVTYLMQLGLIDEYLLWMYPVSLGRGIALFKCKQDLKLLTTRLFSSGVVVLNYEAPK